MLNELFNSIILTSFAGTVFSLFLLLLKPVTKKFFTGSWQYFMWIFTLIIMLIPIKIDLPTPKDVTTVVQETSDIIKNITDYTVNETTSEYLPVHTFNIIPIIWISVAMVLFSTKLLSYGLFLAKIRKISITAECGHLKKYTHKRIEVRKSEMLSSPFMTGIIKPVLILPCRELTHSQLNHILAHEITHFKRKDILLKWFSVIVKCVHWFNPIVYFIAREINAECEISCDISVTKNMNMREKNDYASTILTLLSDKINTPTFSTGMTGNKKILKRRFTMIKNSKATSIKLRIIAIVSAVLVIIFGLFISGVTSDGFENPSQNSTSFILPHKGTITNTFATRIHPITKEQLSHDGVDIKGEIGDLIVASADGIVSKTGFDSQKGNYIIIKHTQNIETSYAHLSEISVNNGDKVSQGQTIGKMGNTGMSTGPHTHFEISRNGVLSDPLKIISEENTTSYFSHK